MEEKSFGTYASRHARVYGGFENNSMVIFQQ